jgi:hypothetical protein
MKLTTEQIHDAAMASHEIISDNLQDWAEMCLGLSDSSDLTICEKDLQEIKHAISLLFTLNN